MWEGETTEYEKERNEKPFLKITEICPWISWKHFQSAAPFIFVLIINKSA